MFALCLGSEVAGEAVCGTSRGLISCVGCAEDDAADCEVSVVGVCA